MLPKLFVLCLLVVSPNGQESLRPKGSHVRSPVQFHAPPAYVFNEHFSALRRSPDLQGPIIERLRLGHLVALISKRRTPDGTLYYRVAASRRKRGWIDAGAVVSPAHRDDDRRLWELLNASEGFARMELCRIMDLQFKRSPLRVETLMIMGREAEAVAESLTELAHSRRIIERPRTVRRTLEEIYLNYEALDRYNRLGIQFRFDPTTPRYSYVGDAYREVLRCYPHHPQGTEAAQRLTALRDDRPAPSTTPSSGP